MRDVPLSLPPPPGSFLLFSLLALLSLLLEARGRSLNPTQPNPVSFFLFPFLRSTISAYSALDIFGGKGVTMEELVAWNQTGEAGAEAA